MEVKAVRGMHDLYGVELDKWRFIEEKIRRTFEDFGYSEIRTPVLEKIEVFSQTVGDDTDIVEKQMYQIAAAQEGGGESLVMRPEGTAAFIRAVVEHQLHRNAGVGAQRYFYYLPMFRHERPQKGRLRQFHQFGAELIGDSSPEADAELIALLDHIYREFKISEYVIKVNSVGCSDCRPAYKEALKAYFKPRLAELCPECQQKLERSPMRILDEKKEACRKVAEGAPLILDHLCETCKHHHATLKLRLEQSKVAYEEDPRIVRGLDYYSRTAFEFTSDLLGAQSALGGGGRYDGLSARFGEAPFPAVGWALGMERLVLVLEQKNAFPELGLKPDYFFAALDPQAFEFLFPLSLELKREGLRVEMAYEKDKKLKWLMKQSDRSEAKFTLLLGEDERKRGEAMLKDMKQGTQAAVALATLKESLIKKIKG